MQWIVKEYHVTSKVCGVRHPTRAILVADREIIPAVDSMAITEHGKGFAKDSDNNDMSDIEQRTLVFF